MLHRKQYNISLNIQKPREKRGFLFLYNLPKTAEFISISRFLPFLYPYVN